MPLGGTRYAEFLGLQLSLPLGSTLYAEFLGLQVSLPLGSTLYAEFLGLQLSFPLRSQETVPKDMVSWLGFEQYVTQRIRFWDNPCCNVSRTLEWNPQWTMGVGERLPFSTPPHKHPNMTNSLF
ncbi:hypothetical protein [Paenibacillus pinisoli]|uniref:hypothetical protein n=1 Tax=Paenibacillus pinisoli TaxID=1276110 RepID=UPI0010588818|nr:hypothetical protein [Paenibacillus pinisoli]